MIGLSIITFVGTTILVFALSTSNEEQHHRLSTASSDYFFGGRSLTWPFISGSILMTHFTIQSFIEFSGQSYIEGYLVALAWEWTALLSLIFCALYLLPRYLANGPATIFGFLEQRFNRSTRFTLALLSTLTYIVLLLPLVLYMGSQALYLIFELPVPPHYLMIGLGLLGSCYTVFGHLKSIMVSDTMYFLGFLSLAFAIPILGLNIIGNDSITSGFNLLLDQHAAFFTPSAPVLRESTSIPLNWAILGLGLLGFQVFYWSTNQVMIHRAMSTQKLADAQKGFLAAAGFKLFSPLLLCLPGLLAFSLMNELSIPIDLSYLKDLLDQNHEVSHEVVVLAQDIIKSGAQRISLDTAETLKPVGFTFSEHIYPALIRRVLPDWSFGVLATVLVGLIISTFNSILHSAATLFCFDIYAPSTSIQSAQSDLVRVAKLFSLVAAPLAVTLAIYLSQSPSYTQYIHSLAMLYGLPILSIFCLSLFTQNDVRHMTTWVITPTLTTTAYLTFSSTDQFHWFYGFFIALSLSALTALWGANTPKRSEAQSTGPVFVHHGLDLDPWPYRTHCSIFIILCLISILSILLWISA